MGNGEVTIIPEYDQYYSCIEKYRVRYNGIDGDMDVGWIDREPGDWVFYPNEEWLTPDELIAIGKALKEFKPRDD